MALRAEVSA
jgi:hypothetical protein